MIKIRHRNVTDSRPVNGKLHTWSEWQVISGRRIIGRHDFLADALIDSGFMEAVLRRIDAEPRTERAKVLATELSVIIEGLK